MKNFLIAALAVFVLGTVFWFVKKEMLVPHPTTTPSPVVEKNITIESPKAGDIVASPIIVKGTARVFENTFAYVLKDEQGNKLYENNAMTDAPDSGIFGNYTLKIPVPVGAPQNLVIEVFEYSAKDGEIINLVRVPVELETPQQVSKVKVYFLNDKLDPQMICTRVFPVEREIVKTLEVGYITLLELLEGPSTKETTSGYSSVIPQGVRINSLKIENGIAYADFNETLEGGVAGSCRVTAIRAEIENTLKQFSSVKSVVISINGRTEDILQP